MRTAKEVLHEFGNTDTNRIVQAMKEYAKQAIEKQLDIVANEATVESETPIGKWHPEYSVDKDSIINCTRIELT